MRIILLTDLHIDSSRIPEDVLWVSHFCDFLNQNFSKKTLIIILGDIVDRGDPSAFEAADKIFSYIESKTASVYYNLVFIPGNHDYCNGTLDYFTEFCKKHQKSNEATFLFSQKSTWNITDGSYNFIFTDSIQEKRYDLPGYIDIKGVSDCICTDTDKVNILFMHHSLTFEDNYSHTGISNQKETIDFLKQNNIKAVFHGHAHATRGIDVDSSFLHFGVGPIGNDIENPLPNENEQFFELKLGHSNIEAIANWMWRGGSQRYIPQSIFPDPTPQHHSGELIPRKSYTCPEQYLKRYLTLWDSEYALQDKTTLFEVSRRQKYIICLAEAGFGKTTELQCLAFKLSTETPYLRPMYFSLNCYNGEALEEYIFDSYPEYRTLDPGQFFLIFDGYDETPYQIDFKRAVLKYQHKFPDTAICLSMRSNFFPEDSSTFKEFAVYQLLGIEHEDIKNLLLEKGIKYHDFMSKCSENHIDGLLQNPFYLNNLISFYSLNHDIPSHRILMDTFVESHFKQDSKKFEFSQDTLVDNQQYERTRALKRLAYGMQLLNKTVISSNDYQSILTEADRRLVQFSGLTCSIHAGHSFLHNIFKEYFVAKYICQLSFSELMAQISIGMKHIKPNWSNIIGFVLQLNPSEEIISWLLNVDPSLLTSLEASHLTRDLRYCILKNNIEKIEQERVWFQNDACSEKHLAKISQSKEAVELLIIYIYQNLLIFIHYIFVFVYFRISPIYMHAMIAFATR